MIQKTFHHKKAGVNISDMNYSLMPTELWERNCRDSGHLLGVVIFDLFSSDNKIQ